MLCHVPDVPFFHEIFPDAMHPVNLDNTHRSYFITGQPWSQYFPRTESYLYVTILMEAVSV